MGVPNKDAVFMTKPINLLNERTLKGTFFGNYKPRTDLPSVVDMYMNKVVIVYLNLLEIQEVLLQHYHAGTNMLHKFFLIILQKLELEKFITHRVPFSEINKAFELMLRGEGLRCIINMEE